MENKLKNKKEREQKSKILAAMPKKAQEEMVGFALILVIVAIIMLVFLGFSLRSPQKESVESYEAESFLQSVLQYTTGCENNVEKLSIQKLVFSCVKKEECLNGEKSCDILNSELDQILSESWKIGEERPVKGHELTIATNKNESIIGIRNGNMSGNSKGAAQDFFRGDVLVNMKFKAFYD